MIVSPSLAYPSSEVTPGPIDANRTASYLRNSIAERVLWDDFWNGLNPVFGPARLVSPWCSTSTNVERMPKRE
jgi:hypothetical protein